MRWSPRSPCVTCGQCCRSYVVSLLGYDVWRISRALRLSPELFVLAHDQPEPADDGFLLDAGGWPQGLALDKRGQFAPGQPCVFLLELGGGHARCGIYSHRPAVCRTYPMALGEAASRLRRDALCEPNAWREDQLELPSWSSALHEYRAQWQVYLDVVERWNAGIRSAPAGTQVTVPDYFRYLLNCYDGMMGGHAEQSDPQVGAWARSVSPAPAAIISPMREGEL